MRPTATGSAEVEDARLAGMKDRFLRFWPDLSCPLVNLEARFIRPGQRVLVVGSGRTGPLDGPGVVNTDLHPYRAVSAVTDVQHLGFRDQSFEAVICHQVLEHVPDSRAAVDEILRVLKPAGAALITVPFYFPFHPSPRDFRRWTLPGLRADLSQFQEVEAGMYLGPVTAVLSGLQHFAGLLAPGFYLSNLVKLGLGYLLWPLKYLDLMVARLDRASHLAAALYFVGRKPAD
jgi:SAM-dependent methyltransferase